MELTERRTLEIAPLHSVCRPANVQTGNRSIKKHVKETVQHWPRACGACSVQMSDVIPRLAGEPCDCRQLVRERASKPGCAGVMDYPMEKRTVGERMECQNPQAKPSSTPQDKFSLVSSALHTHVEEGQEEEKNTESRTIYLSERLRGVVILGPLSHEKGSYWHILFVLEPSGGVMLWRGGQVVVCRAGLECVEWAVGCRAHFFILGRPSRARLRALLDQGYGLFLGGRKEFRRVRKKKKEGEK